MCAGDAARGHRDGRRVPAAAGPAAARGRARAPRRQLRHAAHHLPAHRQRRAGLRQRAVRAERAVVRHPSHKLHFLILLFFLVNTYVIPFLTFLFILELLS